MRLALLRPSSAFLSAAILGHRDSNPEDCSLKIWASAFLHLAPAGVSLEQELCHPRPEVAVVRDLLQYFAAGLVQSPALPKSFRHQSSFPCDIAPSENIECSAVALKTSVRELLLATWDL